MMKRLFALFVFAAFLTATSATAATPKAGSRSTTNAQEAAKAGPKYSPNTGDKEFDVVLSSLNTEAAVHVDAFVSELSISYAIPKVHIEDVVYRMRMPLGDVFVSVWLASSMRKPLPVVVNEYEANKDKGWGVTAKNLGVKPGSDAFHSLKKDSTVELGLAQKRNKEKKADKAEKSEKHGSKGKQKK